MTFTEAVQLFFQNLHARRRSPQTLTWYAEQFSAYQARAPDDSLPTAEQIDAFLASQHAAGLSPSTVHARFRALRALLRFLERRRHISHDDNPIHLVDAPSVPKERKRFVTPADLEALLRAFGQSANWLDYRDRLVVLILFYCGLRLSELTALHVEDVDTSRLEITIRHGKGEKARIVPFPERVKIELVAYLFNRPNHEEYLLLRSDGYGRSSGQFNNEGVRQMLIRRCKRAGIEPLNPHAFRHGFAMWTHNAGVRMEIVSDLMGHSDIAVTSQIYAFTLSSTARHEYDLAVARLNG